MNDAVVIGAGLAGLVAALRIAEAGRRVLVLARGMGATQLGGGPIDLLGHAGDGPVERPAAALAALVRDRPDHPYARVGTDAVAESVRWLAERLAGELPLAGDLERNHVLPSAAGVPRPSAVVPETMAAGDLAAGGDYLIAGFRALRDFYPALLAANLERLAGVRARAVVLEVSPHPGEADVAAMRFARALDDAGFREEVAAELRRNLRPGERVGLPALVGMAPTSAAWRDLQGRIGAPLFEIPTLPPSIPGIRLQNALLGRIRARGGRVVVGPPVTGARPGGRRLEALRYQAAARVEERPARAFLLASGGFASGGLELRGDGEVRETVLDLPVAGADAGGRPTFSPRYLDEQPLARAGLATDARLRPLGAAGPAFENLFAAGAVLAGALPWREGSGNGIALATGYAAAGHLLDELA